MKRAIFVAILLFIVLGESIAIVYLGLVTRQYFLKKNVLGEMTVVPLKKEDYIFSSNINIQGFYEPKPSSTEIDNPNWLPYMPEHTINADSLNERYDYSVQKESNLYRIIVLGDSFTFGDYVNTEDVWSERLEDLLNNNACGGLSFEVINLGVSGYDVQYIAHRYSVRGIKYNPDLIIWFESGSGFTRMLELMRSYIDKYENLLTPEELSAYRDRGIYYPSWSLATKELFHTYTEEQIGKKIRGWWQEFFRIRGTTPVLITSRSLFKEQQQYINELIAHQENVSLMTSISQLREDDLLPDGHPSARGHDVIAKDIHRYLLNSTYFPCIK